jgi:hypothetical protein
MLTHCARRRRQESPVSGASTKETVKTIRAGNAGTFSANLRRPLRVFFSRKLWVRAMRPAFPAPSDQEGDSYPAQLGQKNLPREHRALFESGE